MIVDHFSISGEVISRSLIGENEIIDVLFTPLTRKS